MHRVRSILIVALAAFLLAGCGEAPKAPPKKKAPPKPAPDANKVIADAAKEAEGTLNGVLKLIQDGKLDEAETELKDLEGDMGALPADLQARIKAARAMLEAGKAAKSGAAVKGDVTKPPVDANAAKAIEDAKAEAAKANAEANAQASSLLEKVLALIKDGKLDDADEMLKTLETNLGSLSPDLQAKIKAARVSLTAKKAAGEIKLPGLPK